MILRIDHVAIAVKDYDKAYNFFTRLLGAVPGSGAAECQDPWLFPRVGRTACHRGHRHGVFSCGGNDFPCRSPEVTQR